MKLSKRLTTLLIAAALLLVGVTVLGLVYRQDLLAWATQKEQGAEQAGDQPAPQNHSQHAQAQATDHSQQAAPAPTAGGEREVLYWYDPMHPAYRSDKPGIAPDCGMKLVPKYADEVEAMKGMAPGTVMLTLEKQQMIGVRTAEARRGRLVRTIRTVGRVKPDETKIARVHVKVAGWVEQVYVDFVGKLVKKGDPLFTLYSPDLVSTQEEYLIARRGEEFLGDSRYSEVASGAKSLLKSSRERLRLWDISEEQIDKLEESGKPSRTLALNSPIDGFVMHRNLYESTYVDPSMQLYEIADLSKIWVDADIYEYEAPYVRLGMPATVRLSYAADKAYTGRVTYVYPTVDPKARTVRIRLEFPNPDFGLKPDMFADVELRIDYGSNLLVPTEAVLDSGTRQLVFVAKGGGFFEPRQVKVGARLDGQYVVLGGLKEGETIVTSGNFLIDSESRLSSAVGETSHKH